MPVTTPIVGIGASAGGLEAIEQFIKHIPAASGMAYIVVQHLDPTQKAMLPELIQRYTAMPVQEAKHNMLVEPDQVYVIPPNTELRVVDGRIILAQPLEPRGMRLPINILFSSLATSLGERAIGVILSGMGTDGTPGMLAIKAVGGLTAVQQPDSAQFNSMPCSAIAAGCADIVALPAQIPERLRTYLGRVSDPVLTDLEHKPADVEPLVRIIRLLQHHTRHDFAQYKPSTLHRRIERRMAIHALETPALYADFLEKNPAEVGLLFKELLIGVTEFFRDPQVWEKLTRETLPDLLSRRTTEPNLRAWVVGCSTGEEAYSLAIAYTEAIEQLPEGRRFSLQIFASDLSAEAIAAGRRGEYPVSIKERMSAARLTRFFTAHDNCYRISEQIRDMVLFAQHDVLLDPPFTKLDVLTCRNLLIYFDATLQRKLLPLFHYSLRPGGVLLLGSSETTGRFSHLFEAIDAKMRLYLRLNSRKKSQTEFFMSSFPRATRTAKELPVPPPSTPNQTPGTLQAAADQVLLQVFAPAAVVVNSTGDIIYISGRTGKYLEPAAGKANWNIHAMVRDGLRGQVSAALSKAPTQTEPIHLYGLQVQLPGSVQRVDVTVQALQEPPALRNMVMIVFRDVAGPITGKSLRKTKNEFEISNAVEIQKYREQIYELQEKTRASEEELQSANEELQSTNEELQSSNEELTTSKEEMQSMNEELQTINAELRSKLDDLSLAQSDLKNLLNSVEIAILFLDQNLNVRRFTDQVSNIFNLREIDIGRPLSDLSTVLQYPELHDDAKETLRTLVFTEKQVCTSDGRWFTVRIMPYRRLDNMIDGVVITLVDTTETKRLEIALRQQNLLNPSV